MLGERYNAARFINKLCEADVRVQLYPVTWLRPMVMGADSVRSRKINLTTHICKLHRS
jgi:hypothetical protein